MTREEIIKSLPDSIKVLHRRFKLTEKSMMEFSVDRRLGSTNLVKGEIEFLDTGDTDVVETIIHEALHAVWAMFDLPNDPKQDDLEEHVVRTLATGLVTIMTDNPRLFLTLQALLDDTAAPAGD